MINNAFVIYNCLCAIIICVDILTNLGTLFPMSMKKNRHKTFIKKEQLIVL